MAESTVTWTGASGKQYKYWISEIDGAFKDEPGNYIFAKETSAGRWAAIYIGETDCLKTRLPNHEKLPCVRRYEGTHIHVHTNSSDESVRRAEESDLIENNDPPCNRE